MPKESSGSGAGGPLLRLRPEQLQAFAGVARGGFVERALAVVETCWPATFQAQGKAAMRGVVERALVAAERFGVTDRQGVLRWINLTLALGEGFPELPWAAAVLARQDLRSATRMEILAERAARVVAAEDGR
jgi:hypothetical protein